MQGSGSLGLADFGVQGLAWQPWAYYRGLNNYQYRFEVHLKYHRPCLYEEYGTIILAI